MRNGALFAPMAFSAFRRGGQCDDVLSGRSRPRSRLPQQRAPSPRPLGHPSLHTRLLAAAVSAIINENICEALQARRFDGSTRDLLLQALLVALRPVPVPAVRNPSEELWP